MTDDEPRYAAFISYSHGSDERLALELRRALERFGSRWLKARGLAIWQDRASLALTPDLWASIELALARSESLLVMLSPSAARSVWVRRELECFASSHPRQKIGFVLTAGSTRWTDAGAGDCDVEIESLVGEYVDAEQPAIPLLIDLRPFRPTGERSSRFRDPRFIEQVASIAAWLQGKSKDEIYGEHIARQRREKWILAAVGAVLLVFFLLAQVQALRAETARQDERSNGAALLAAQPGRELEALEQGIGVASWALRNDLALWAMQPGRQLRLSVASLQQALLGDRPPALVKRPALLRGLMAAKSAANHERTITNSKASVSGIDYSPDGRRLLVAGRNADVYRVSDGAWLEALPPLDGLRSAVFVNDRAALTTSAAGLELWGMTGAASAAQARWRTPLGPNGLARVVASADATFLLTIESQHITLRRTSDPDRILFELRPSAEQDHFSTAALSSDAVRVGIVALDGVSVFELDPSRTTVLARQRLESTASEACALVFSPVGSLLASGHVDGTIVLSKLEVTPGAGLSPLSERPFSAHSDRVTALDFFPQGAELLSGGADGRVRLWSLTKATVLAEWFGSRAAVTSVTVAPDGLQLASGSLDGKVRVYRRFAAPLVLDVQPTAFGRFVEGTTSEGAPRRAEFSPDGAHLAVLDGRDQLKTWEIASGAPREGSPHRVEAFGFRSDGTLATTPKPAAVIEAGAAPATWCSAARQCRLSSQAEFGLAVDDAGVAQIVSMASGSRTPVQRPAGPVQWIELSDAARKLTLLDASGISIYDLRDGRALRHLRATAGTEKALLSSSGSWVLQVAFANSARLTSVWTRQPDRIIRHTANIDQALWSPDGERFVTADVLGEVRLVTASPFTDQPLLGHDARVKAAAFSLDSALLALSAGRGVELWDVASRERLGTLELSDLVTSIAFSRDGAKLAALSEDGRAFVFSADARGWFTEACSLLPPKAVAHEDCATAFRALER